MKLISEWKARAALKVGLACARVCQLRVTSRSGISIVHDAASSDDIRRLLLLSTKFSILY